MAEDEKAPTKKKTAKKPKAPGKRRTVEKPLSLYPLTFEEAVGELLKVKMGPEELRKRKR